MSVYREYRAVIIKNKITLKPHRTLPTTGRPWTYTISKREQLSTDMPADIYTPLMMSAMVHFLDAAHVIVLYQEELRDECLRHLVGALHHRYPMKRILVVARRRPRLGHLGWIFDHPRCSRMAFTAELSDIEDMLNKLLDTSAKIDALAAKE